MSHELRTYPFLAALFWALTLPACSVPPTLQNDKVVSEEELVLAREDAYVEAEISRDESALRDILDDDFVFNLNNGSTLGKEELIEQILSWKMTGQTITERTVVVEGETAVIAGTAEIRFASETGEDTVQRLRYTAVYAKRSGEWRFLALHMSARGT